jgi:hypothetical protein
MDKKNEHDLQEAIDEFAYREAEKERRLAKEHEDRESWSVAKDRVIVPALREVEAKLKDAGWQCQIDASGESVRFAIYRGNMMAPGAGERPHVLFMPQENKKFGVSMATTDMRTGLEGAALEQIDADFIQSRAIEFFKALSS